MGVLLVFAATEVIAFAIREYSEECALVRTCIEGMEAGLRHTFVYALTNDVIEGD